MFRVIADDLTGAAEIGGVAWRYGFSAETHIGAFFESEGGVAIADTDSRSLSPEDAAGRIRELAPMLRGWRVFKKVDSVLRGPVYAEVEALAEAAGFRRALLVPCNPSLGRTIERGEYRVDGTPIHETEFGRDPEHPAPSSQVRDLLRAAHARVLPAGSELPDSGIAVGEAATEADILGWAARLDAGTLPAGAASFFAAILEHDGLRMRLPGPQRPLEGKSLLITASASEQSRRQLEAMQSEGARVFPLPAPVAAIVDALASGLRAALTARARDPLIDTAERVLKEVSISELWVEGGATASALVRRFGWRMLMVDEEIAPGVVALRPPGFDAPRLVLKPGSYRWGRRTVGEEEGSRGSRTTESSRDRPNASRGPTPG
ncbi:MAG: hypothetical protein KIT09_23230 [Bryobacteraceae bacterium]|nr:hypothetical protein [Bryobacteraceae bacterium]